MTLPPKRKSAPKPIRRTASGKPIAPRSAMDRDAYGLLPKERAFVLHYLGASRRIASDAALRAGYGKAEGTVQEQKLKVRKHAHVVMKRPHVLAEIERLTEERNERLTVTADDILLRLAHLEAEATMLGRSAPNLRLRREIIKDMGDHVAVGAFRRQVGLSNPSGGPIETADVAWLATATDEELEAVDRARAIIERLSGQPQTAPAEGRDPRGTGETEEEAGG